MSIYRLEPDGDLPERWVIATCGVWLPGAYESKRAARFAFKLHELQLMRLRDEANAACRLIRWSDIKAAADQHRAEMSSKENP